MRQLNTATTFVGPCRQMPPEMPCVRPNVRPCKQISPEYSRLAKEFTSVRFAKVCLRVVNLDRLGGWCLGGDHCCCRCLSPCCVLCAVCWLQRLIHGHRALAFPFTVYTYMSVRPRSPMACDAPSQGFYHTMACATVDAIVCGVRLVLASFEHG